jgi:hypothetical protein
MAVQRGRTTQAPGSVLIDTEGRHGASPATHFKPLLRSIQRALESGDTAVALSGAKLNVVILALQKVWPCQEFASSSIISWFPRSLARGPIPRIVNGAPAAPHRFWFAGAGELE